MQLYGKYFIINIHRYQRMVNIYSLCLTFTEDEGIRVHIVAQFWSDPVELLFSCASFVVLHSHNTIKLT